VEGPRDYSNRRIGLSIAEEFVIQQTSLAPLPWPAIGANYGRLGGVHWIFFLFMLGYECVWIKLVPIQLAELIFSDRRKERWLGNRGVIISAVIFVLGSFIAWAAWIKRARPIVFHAPEYTPPLATILAGFWLISLIFGSRSPLPFWIPIIMALLWAALVYLVIRYWSSSTRWQDIDRWALVFGATLACMIAGFSGSSHWPRIDLIGKAVLNVLAVVGLLLLAARIRQRSA
jgi:hypothetical protein